MRGWTNGDGWSGWQMSGAGYLPLEMIGYALGLHLFLQGRDFKGFEKEMEKGFRRLVKQSLGFLQQNPQLEPELMHAQRKLRAGFTE